MLVVRLYAFSACVVIIVYVYKGLLPPERSSDVLIFAFASCKTSQNFGSMAMRNRQDPFSPQHPEAFSSSKVRSRSSQSVHVSAVGGWVNLSAFRPQTSKITSGSLNCGSTWFGHDGAMLGPSGSGGPAEPSDAHNGFRLSGWFSFAGVAPAGPSAGFASGFGAGFASGFGAGFASGFGAGFASCFGAGFAAGFGACIFGCFFSTGTTFGAGLNFAAAGVGASGVSGVGAGGVSGFGAGGIFGFGGSGLELFGAGCSAGAVSA